MTIDKDYTEEETKLLSNLIIVEKNIQRGERLIEKRKQELEWMQSMVHMAKKSREEMKEQVRLKGLSKDYTQLLHANGLMRGL